LIDIDGDCFSDLVLFTIDPNTKVKRMEIWKGLVDKSIYYCLNPVNVKTLDSQIGLVSFADADRDGMVDILFPVFYPNKAPTISILFNQIKNEIDWSADYCKEKKKDSKNITQVFQDIRVNGVDDVKSQIFIKLIDDPNKSFYNNLDLKLFALIRTGK